ncbi:PorT family protein [Carboxylicivirga mesophila]|uniref:PorT family protein n=1 Tax=Carboxylicivirga mesophila TaxID=1166478 RepID=A0ABS5K654_9BACT|nr:outer membrane beta-barrel protein [Carboxylicivirga mesophila]MBS2210474.1 PorT family protein [Carboxylicivirga mesophila]
MKRILIIFLAIGMLSLGSNVKAEEGPDGRGIRAGYQNSFFKIDGDEAFDDPYNNFYVGYFNSSNIVPMLKWDSGIEYFQVGGKTGDAELKLHYLSVPLSLKLKIGPVYALGGVNGAVKLGGSSDFAEFGADVGDFSTLDAGAHLGVGFKFLMLGVEARYTWGLVNQTEADLKSEYLQLGAVLFF